MEQEDKLIARFFDERKIEIADNGFSKRVCRQLPRRRRRLSRLWTVLCSVLGLGLFYYIDGLKILKNSLLNIFGDLEGYATLVSVGTLSPMLIVLALLTIGYLTMISNPSSR